jgi:ABC-type sugar transport system permease subunit
VRVGCLAKAFGVFKVVAGFLITVVGLATVLSLFEIQWMKDPQGALLCVAFAACFLTSGIVCTVSGVRDCGNFWRP